ncbi:Helix-turn-helix [uncultured archaeon]|nr:Helix-turn-helix [uncultured archaeon]
MRAPCQTVVWYLLPAVGAELARELSGKGLPQKEVAKRLGITPAAVSQYLKGSRGSEVKLGKKTLAEIRKLAVELERGGGERDATRAMCGICRIAWSERVLCGIHAEKKTCASCSDGKTRCE